MRPQACYQANPALFANRKVYDLRQIAVSAGAEPPALRDTSIASAEVARLRMAAKIEYVDQSLASTPADAKKPAAANEVQGVAKPDDAISKGVSGLS